MALPIHAIELKSKPLKNTQDQERQLTTSPIRNTDNTTAEKLCPDNRQTQALTLGKIKVKL